MNPEQKKLALSLLIEAQAEFEHKFEVSDFEKLISIDAPTSDQRVRDLKKAINTILE